MRIPTLSTLALTASLALSGCGKATETPDKLADVTTETRVQLSDKEPEECTVEKTSVEWDLIQGRCDEAGLAQGPGKAISNEGGFKDGKFDGHGIYTWPNGDKYVGEWKDSEKVKDQMKTYKTPNAMYVYAAGLEAGGKVDEAKEAYQHLMRIKPDSDAAMKASERMLILSSRAEKTPQKPTE